MPPIYARREERFLKAYAEFYRNHQQEMLKLFPGAMETLEALDSSGYRLGLVTSKRRELTVCQHVHDRTGPLP